MSTRDGNWEIYVMNVDGSGQTRLTHSSAEDSHPSWSPDGRRIAFESYRDGNSEIYVMNADGSGVTRLTDNEAADFFPSWSPDGRRIAFTSSRDPGDDHEIYVMNADGSGVTRLTDNAGNDYHPSWSPDGRRIAFNSSRFWQEAKYDIYVMNADGSGQTRLTDNPGWETLPSWSPDGRRIAFIRFSYISYSGRDSGSEIYVMNADGSGLIRLTDNSVRDRGPSWSPGGRRIAFSSHRDGDSEIYVMNADGSDVTRLTNNPANDDWPHWSPVGGEGAAPAPDQPPFELEWETSASGVEAGKELILTVRMHGVRQPGEHGGISVSFPSLTEPGGSKEWYSSSLAEVEAIHYTSGTSSVTFHQPGATIYHRDGNRQFPAEYLLVESDDPSWSRSDDRVLMLRITPKRSGEFPIQVRGWLCRDEYTNCARSPASGTATDQQGWFVEVETVRVTAAE